MPHEDPLSNPATTAKLTPRPAAPFSVKLGPEAESKRSCGECTLCCRLVPVRELHKGAGERCQHQRHTGCRIYDKRPTSCRFWTCRWLSADDTAELSRPDRSHYVIDAMPDYIQVMDNDTGTQVEIPVVQVWLDPKHPDAYRDPALRAYLERRAVDGYAALIRLNARDGFSLFAPPLASDGQWHEIRHGTAVEQHSRANIVETLSKAGQR